MFIFDLFEIDFYFVAGTEFGGYAIDREFA